MCTKQGLGQNLEFCNLYISAIGSDRAAECIFFFENNTITLNYINFLFSS